MITKEQSELLKETLEKLYNQALLDIAYDGYSAFVDARNLLLSFFNEDIEKSLSIINSLDFNNPIFAHLVTFIPEIVQQISSADDRKIFIDRLHEIKSQYPKINFDLALFYASLV